ncbi:MAG: prepilin peptidase [Desulfomonilia bacterium]|uniref:Type 4 prepilin-like proteins leader peptide-processing enzyme n=1 Tax=anaerobic digester metagenome TaxID=1263854 RepID=A0A485M444_9ZZZZ|nr:prepilin peptidase [Pseudomonadota bacterium]HPD20123.1 prepilin peptidase [Deltaproteobacteria bacterium]HRS54905.1 prepilin peptidase [Desulfomonilia bacterium]HRV34340.1 prepilin peptidase [Desulfomonilia bacterium]
MILSVPLAVAVIGLFIGSFLNVCIHRIPREESIVFPSSRCPGCGAKIKPWDNIPVLSYLILRGKCRSCKEKISIRYPLVETLSALLALAMLYRFGLNASFAVYYAWACALLVITFIDLDHQIIPDSLSIGGIVVGLALVWWMPVSYKDAFIGLGLGAGLLVAVIYGYYFLTGKQGMGGGDVKLLGMIGVFTGWQGVLFTIFTGSLLGSLVGIPWALLQKKNMQTAIPFGPFLALGALLYVLFGEMIITWYFGILA